MATVVHKVRGPDGKIHKVRGPADAKPAQIMQVVKWKLQDANEKRSQNKILDEIDEERWQKDINPTRGFFSNMAAGAGKTITDAGLGVKDAFTDAFGSDESKAAVEAEIAEKRKIDAPLMETGGGVTGAIAGGAAMMAPTALIPGANTMVGAGIAGGLFGAAQPTMGDESRLMNTGVGAAGGMGGQAIANRAVAARAARDAQLASPEGRTLKWALDEGIKLDPAATNPSIFKSIVRGASGRAKFEKKLSADNQEHWNRLARRELGLAPDTEISVAELSRIRQQAGAVYKEITDEIPVFHATPKFYQRLEDAFGEYEKLLRDSPNFRMKELDDIREFLSRDRFEGDTIMHHLRRLRQNAEAHFSKAGGEKPNANQLDMGRAYKEAAKAMEEMIADNLEYMGKTRLYERFVQARQEIAKTYTYEKALLPNGDIDTHVFGRALAAGKKLYGDAERMGELARMYPNTTRRIPGGADPVSGLSMGLGAGGAALDSAAMVGLAAGRPVARSIGAGPIGQRMANPYTSKMAQLGGPGLLGNRGGQAVSRGMGAAGTGYWNPFEPEPQQGPPQ